MVARIGISALRFLGGVRCAVLVATMLTLPVLAQAGPCGGEAGVATNVAYAISPTVCTGGAITWVYKKGAVVACIVTSPPQSPFNGRPVAFAAWNSETARTEDISGGCTFRCPADTCFVDRVGLPVELLQFGVE